MAMCSVARDVAMTSSFSVLDVITPSIWRLQSLAWITGSTLVTENMTIVGLIIMVCIWPIDTVLFELKRLVFIIERLHNTCK